MSFLDIKRNFLFIHTPRTAGTSMTKVLGGNDDHKSIRWFRDAYYQNTLTGIDYPKIFKFAFVRNPYDRLYSAYLFNKPSDGVYERGIFYEFVMSMKTEGIPHHIIYQPQSHFLLDENGELGLDFVGRFESLQKDWKKVCKKIGVRGELPQERKTDHPDYEKVYDRYMKEVVYSLYKKDFHLFRYKP